MSPLQKSIGSSGAFFRNLFQQVEAERQDIEVNPEDCATHLRNTIRRLIPKKHCSKMAEHWVKPYQVRSQLCSTPCRQIKFSEKADGRAAMGHPALRLSGLDALEDGALLTMAINIDHGDRLIGYSIGLQGTARCKTRGFYARIDLHEAGMDALPMVEDGGFANHPLLHLQFGADPNDSSERPAARAPLPFLLPWHAVDWLLAITHPSLEPEPFRTAPAR